MPPAYRSENNVPRNNSTRTYFTQHKISPRQPLDDPSHTNLHANIIPASSNPILERPHYLSIAFIAAGSFTALLLGLLLVFFMYKGRRLSSLSAFKWCRRRSRPRKGKTLSEKRTLSDDSTWGTGPTRMVYVESVRTSSDDNPDSPAFQTVDLATNPDIHSLSSSTEKLVLEERDIASGYNLTVDLADWENRQAFLADAGQDAFSVLDVSIFQSLQDNIDDLARGKAVRGRPRQGSDASDSSHETRASDITDCFSPATSASASSMTSLATTDDELDEDDVYEVRRAQTQSIEFKRGILVSLQSNGALADVLAPEVPPTVVIWESSSAHSIGDKNSLNTISSLAASFSTRTYLSQYPTIPSLASSQMRDVSSGTMDSLATSFSISTRTEGRWTDDEGFLLPPIPHLMVTRPSNSSIYTLGSTSSVSIDLNDFPLPPLPRLSAKPIYLKLLDRIQARKRMWDNHVVDTTMIQKRSTMEQFIMMYAA